MLFSGEFMDDESPISIWFFIGVALLVNGALILAAGIYDLFHPPAHRVVLSELHAGIWWGGILLGLGIFYFFRFYPRRSSTARERVQKS